MAFKYNINDVGDRERGGHGMKNYVQSYTDGIWGMGEYKR